jgi:L-fuculose-phosphate aldolase
MVEFGRRLYERNYIGAAEGNLSVRLADGRIMITPSGANKGFMKPDDLVICDAAGKKMQGDGKPSSEIKLHVTIYNWRTDVTAICHAHPVYATAYSAARIPLMRPILPEVVGTIGGVPLTPYAMPGSSELPQSLAGLIERYDAFLLEAHGVLTLGKTLEDAFNKIETIERYASILFVAVQLGNVKDLPEREIDRLLKAAGRSNIKGDIMKHAVDIAPGFLQPEKSVEAPPESPQSRQESKKGKAGYR